jgi:hypothetical protein
MNRQIAGQSSGAAALIAIPGFTKLLRTMASRIQLELLDVWIAVSVDRCETPGSIPARGCPFPVLPLVSEATKLHDRRMR